MIKFTEQDKTFMQRALELARIAEDEGEVPIGAVVVLNDEIIGEGFNCPIDMNDPTAHAEIIALREAAHNQKNYRLPETTLYVTLEPCAMCAAAMVHARIKRVVFGAHDPRTGAMGGAMNFCEEKFLNHRVIHESGLLEKESGQLLKDFFQRRRL